MLKQHHVCFRDCVIYYKSTQLHVELAITVDVGDALVKVTYNLEGDGPLALSTDEHVHSWLFLNYSALSQYCCNLLGLGLGLGLGLS